MFHLSGTIWKANACFWQSPLPGDVLLSIKGLGTGGETMQRRERIQSLNMSVLLSFQDHQLISQDHHAKTGLA